MSKQLFLLMRSKTIFDRIVKDTDKQYISDYLPNFQALQNYLLHAVDQPVAVLLDDRWDGATQAQALFMRLGTPVTSFEDFTQSNQWLLDHLPLCTETEKKIEETISKPDRFSQDTKTSQFKKDIPAIPENSRSKHKRVTNRYLKTDTTKKTEPVGIPTTEVPSSKVTIKTIIQKEIIEKPIYVKEQVIQTLSPRLIVFVSLWPGAGTSFISTSLSYSLSSLLEPGSVSLIEHPNQNPRYWVYFRLYESNLSYTHFLQDGKGQSIPVGNVELVPVPQDIILDDSSDEKTIVFIHRHLRKPFVIVDAGSNNNDAMLLESADDVYLIFDCDPSRIYSTFWIQTANKFLSDYPDAHVILNKWTRHVDSDVLKLSKDHLYIPYIDPDLVQRSAWNGTFPTEEPQISIELESFTEHFVHKWIPKELIKDPDPKPKHRFFNLRRKNK